MIAYDIEVHKTDEQFAIGNIVFVPQNLLKNDGIKRIDEDRYLVNKDALAEAEAAKMLTIHEVEVGGESDEDAPPTRPTRKGTPLDKMKDEVIREKLNQEWPAFMAFISGYASDEQALDKLADIVESMGIQLKKKEIVKLRRRAHTASLKKAK